jgi:tRNA(Ile)-lysidine synthase TilS/MesJ
MNRCIKCILPETFPGIRFNEEGVCNFCLEFKGLKHLKDKRMDYKKKFEALIKEYKGKNSFDALMCYSGGKDSTYTSIVLKNKYKLNILAVTFDNGFISEQAFCNIKNVMENLGIDHIILKPRFDILKKIFCECNNRNIYSLKTIERASTICTSCMGLVKFSALRMALEKDIPFITFGWSPGQAPITSSIMKNNPQMLKIMQKALFEPLYQIVGDAIRPYFLEEKHFNGSYQFPYNIHPLAFLGYNEEKIYETIYKYGWKAPQDTDANSTNCLLNSYANVVHKKQFHFNPYSLELANLVREGYLNRELALEKINKIEDPKTVAFVKKKLGLK